MRSSILLALCVGAAIPGLASNIDTVTSTGASENKFALRTDAYLGACGLADGNYYFQVTSPSGATLRSTGSLDPDRKFNMAGGVLSYSGGQGTGTGACGGTSIHLAPFIAAVHGCVYKVWVSPDPTFPSNNSATKTFKSCDTAVAPSATSVSGRKFYDANHDGIEDAGEVGLPGWEIDVTYTYQSALITAEAQTTDAGGEWAVLADPGTTLTACEVMKPNYRQTFPNVNTLAISTFSPFLGTTYCWSGAVPADDTGGVDFGNVATASGTKYYDTNVNGTFDGNAVTEPPIQGFKVLSCVNAGCPSGTSPQYTDASGKFSIDLPTPTSTYTFCEVLPPPSPTWLQTGPLNLASPIGNLGSGTAVANTVKCWLGSGPANGLYLTNVCYVTTAYSPKSMGWYKNAGNPSISGSDLTALDALNLRNANGSAFDPTTQAQMKTWLGGATAVNMAYMLSAQFAVMKLNVLHGYIPDTVLIYAPGTNSANGAGFAQLGALMTEANSILVKGSIPSGDSDRPRAEAVKTALDNANNDLNIIGGPADCIPHGGISPY